MWRQRVLAWMKTWKTMRQKMKSSAFTTTSMDHFKKNLRSVWKFRLNPLWTSSFSLSLFVEFNGHSGKVLMWSFVSPATQIERLLSARRGCKVHSWCRNSPISCKPLPVYNHVRKVPTWRGDGSWGHFTFHSVVLRAAATAWTLSGCGDTEHFLSFFSHQTKKILWRTLTSRSPRYCKNKRLRICNVFHSSGCFFCLASLGCAWKTADRWQPITEITVKSCRTEGRTWRLRLKVQFWNHFF